MLHGLKLALSSRTDKHLLATDQRLREADQTVSDLQRWFPQLQALIEENDKTWTTLSYNIRTLARTVQEIYPPQHSMHYTLDHLHDAGDQIAKPPPDHPLAAERSSAYSELRSFNEQIRHVRSLQMECVAALRERDYYHTKVETLRVNENRKKKVSERDVEKRLRNEQKLAQVEGELRFKWEQLQKELSEVERGKQVVLELALRAFAKTQDFYFARNPMASVLALIGGVQSPTGVRQGDFADEACAPPVEVDVDVDVDVGQPPRAPSPVLNEAGEIVGPLYPQI